MAAFAVARRTEALIDAARKTYGVPAGADIAAAAGTQALIQVLPYLAAPGPVAIVGPTYSEHALAWRNAGHPVIAIDNLDACPESAVHAVVVNPNNPDGRVTDRAALTRIAAQLKGRGGWLVVDEAFADVDPAISAVALCSGLACRDLALVREILWPCRTAAGLCDRRARYDRAYRRRIGTMAVFRAGAVDRHGGARRSAMGRSHTRQA